MRIVADIGSALATTAKSLHSTTSGPSAKTMVNELEHVARTGSPIEAGRALRALDDQTDTRRASGNQATTAVSSPAAANPLAMSLTADIGAVVHAAGEVVHAAGDVGRATRRGVGQVAAGVAQAGPLAVASDVASVTVTQAGRIGAAIAQHRDDPAGFVNWLAGPDGPSTVDWTAAVPGLQQGIGTVLDGAMQNPLIAGAIGKAFGFEYVPGGDFYTTNEGSLQSNFGFHAVYDKVGKLMGMDLDDKVMEFEANGVQYKVELWKGSYGNGGAFGGEIGLYTRGAGDRGPLGNLLEKIPGYYSAANGPHQIATTQTIYNKHTGEPYFTNNGAGADDGKHYWNLAIRTDPGVRHEDIGQRGTLTMNDPASAKALCDAMNERGAEMRAAGKPSSLAAEVHGNTVSYVWE